MVKSDNGIEERVRIVFARGDRPAISTTAFAVLLIVVLVVGGAIGIYYPRSGQKASSSSTTSPSSTATSSSSATPSSSTTTSSATPSSSTTTSSSTAATSSSTSSSVNSNTTATPPGAAPPFFNFSLSSAPTQIIIAPGDTVVYPNVNVIPLPSANEGQAVGLNNGAGDELVVLNSVEPSGIFIHFFGSNLTNT